MLVVQKINTTFKYSITWKCLTKSFPNNTWNSLSLEALSKPLQANAQLGILNLDWNLSSILRARTGTYLRISLATVMERTMLRVKEQRLLSSKGKDINCIQFSFEWEGGRPQYSSCGWRGGVIQLTNSSPSHSITSTVQTPL